MKTAEFRSAAIRGRFRLIVARAQRQLHAAVDMVLHDRRIALRRRHLFALDVASAAAAAYLAVAIRLDGLPGPSDLYIYLPIALVPVAIRPGIAIAFGLYSRVWRYASVPDLFQILKATAAGTAISLLVVYAVLGPLGVDRVALFPRSFWISEGILALAFFGILRFAIRVASDWEARASADLTDTHRIPTLLFGAGQAGIVIARSAFRQPKAGVRPVGFLDDDPRRRGQTLGGLRVLGGLDQLKDAVDVTNARMLLITMPSAHGAAIRRVMEAGLAAGLEVRTVPPLHELMDGSIDAFRARRVHVEDLLGRPLATEHAPAVDDLVRDRIVMVTGAGGSIGSELARQLYSLRPRKIVILDRAESPLYTIERELEIRRLMGRGAGEVRVHLANVVSRALMARVVAEEKPDVIFHAAAYKHVPMMEEHPSESVQVNVGGTMSMLDAAVAAGVPRFVFVSTDKAVEPSSVMGATKRVAEALVTEVAQSTGLPYVSVRFGNVLGSAGSVLPIFLSQLERGEALTVTHPEMTRYFMTIPEAGWLILDAAALGDSADLFVLDMGQPIRILDLAKDLIRLSGRSPDSVPIQFTGLRPGEKLHERLFYDHETVEPTEVAKVLRASRPDSPADIRIRVADLIGMAAGDRDGELRQSLFGIVFDLTPGGSSSEQPSQPASMAARQSIGVTSGETDRVGAEA